MPSANCYRGLAGTPAAFTLPAPPHRARTRGARPPATRDARTTRPAPQILVLRLPPDTESARQEHQLPPSTCHVRSGPWTTWRVTGPDRTVAPSPWRPTSRQPWAGMIATPPCRANQAAAATGVGWPPRPDARDSENAEPLAQAHLAVAVVTGAVRDVADWALLDPHADTTSRQATMQPPNAAGCNTMPLRRAAAAAGSRIRSLQLPGWTGPERRSAQECAGRQ